MFADGTQILRGVNSDVLENWSRISEQPFFQQFLREHKVIATELVAGASEDFASLDGWDAVLSHERVPFVSYPYEWSFGMLQDAALLHLELLETSLTQGWTLKDASAYNVQWRHCRPVFIDIPSFEPYQPGEPWKAYRQFCMMFLIPLMLQSYKGIDFRLLLRSNLEGIEPAIADRIFGGLSRFRKGVFGNVFLHSRMQARAARRDLDEARRLTEDSSSEVAQRGAIRHSEAMVLGTVQSLHRTITRLRNPDGPTTWGNYDTDHSYSEASFQAKKSFVDKHASSKKRSLVWDIGCNTGTFSQICAPHADAVVSIDGDAKAIEGLYRTESKKPASNILPLIMDLSNMSPDQGWRGMERRSLEARGRPDLVVCLALIHHMVISANIPLEEFIGWLHSLGGDVIIEFVSASDDMSQMLLRNRINQYKDLTEEQFERLVAAKFRIADSAGLKGGHRKLYYLNPL